MSDKNGVKSNSKMKNNPKEKNDLNKFSTFAHNHPNKISRPKSKNFNLKSQTPIKNDKFNNNKMNINNSTVIPSNNNHYNINNNISININIDMTNNDSTNKLHKSINGIKNKSVSKKNPISIKKEDLRNNNSLILRDPKHSKINSIKQPNKKSFHSRIKSSHSGLKDLKYNINKNKIINHKHNFSLTATGFNPKKMENNKSTIEQKNISVDDLIVENKNNSIEPKKDFTISSNYSHINSKPLKLTKKTGKKRNTFSPVINRELLNNKQNAILNYSSERRKINIQKDIIINDINKNKNLKSKNNLKDMSTSPFVKNKNISMKNKTNLNKSSNGNNNMNINNSKDQSLISKTKSINNDIKTNKLNLNEKINKSKLEFGSPNINDKKVSKFNKDKNIEKNELDQNNKRRGSHGLKNIIKTKNENKNKKFKEENEGKKKKDDEKKKQEEKKKKIQDEEKGKEEEKRKMNQSKSQLDISPDFIKKQLEEKVGETVKTSNLKSTDREPKKIIRMESICKKGFAGPGVKKTNQDNFFIYNNFINNPTNLFLGVCDGHGLYGQDVSGYLVNNLPQNLNSCLINLKIKDITKCKFDEISRITSQIFVNTDNNLVNDDRVDSTFSGSTCSALIYSPERLISANVGDSRCVLGKFDGKNWTAKNLTRDHKPNEPDENKRIIENGGRVQSYKDEDGEFVGPERVWLKEEEVPGLAMSRSFGDEIAHTVGVTAEPEIFDYNFLHEDKFILLASDGIWEFISSDECVNIVKDYYLKDDIDGALSYLYKESSKRWIMEEEVIDDITLIIIFLN